MVGYLYPEVSKYVAKIFCCWDDVVTCENYISVKCLLISVSQSVTKVSRRPKFNVALMSGRNPHMFINEYENTFVWVSRQNDLTLFLSTLNVKKGGVGLKLKYVNTSKTFSIWAGGMLVISMFLMLIFSKEVR